MTKTGNESSNVVEPVSGLLANRRDILRTATGLAAAAVVGGALVERNQVAVAASSSTLITGQIGDHGPFQIESFSWGVSNSGSLHTGGGGGAGQASFQDISITKKVDKSSPKLMVAVARGTHFPTATISYTDNKGNPILRFELSKLLVSSLSLGGGNDSEPTEHLTLNFEKVKMSYQEESGEWNVAENKGA